jgi:hypothetical protein
LEVNLVNIAKRLGPKKKIKLRLSPKP